MDINNISPYIPTQYVDYSTPDINAVNLNKAEVALQRVTAAANEAINAIKELNAAKIDTAKIVTSLASTDTLSVLSGAIGPVIDQRLTDLLNKYNQLNGEMIKTADATWFDNGLKISIIGTPGDANYRLSFQSKKNNVWYGDILFDRHD